MGGLKGHYDVGVIALSLANVAAQQAGIGTILLADAFWQSFSLPAVGHLAAPQACLFRCRFRVNFRFA